MTTKRACRKAVELEERAEKYGQTWKQWTCEGAATIVLVARLSWLDGYCAARRDARRKAKGAKK